MSADVRIHIDRLVLDRAFVHLDRAVVGASVEAELARLLEERGAPAGLGGTARTAHMDVGGFESPPGTDAEVVGKHVARCMYGGLGR